MCIRDSLRVAEDEGWLNKLGKIIELRKSSRPGDFERAMNRAVNYVQAWRARAFCDRMLNRLIKQADENLDDLVFQVDEKINSKTGDVNTSRKINARWAADLVSAIEKAQSLTYLALNDTVQDRNRRKEQAADEGDQAASDLHTRIAAAMHEVGASTSPRALLFDDQLRIAGEMKQEATAAPPSPYDRDH